LSGFRAHITTQTSRAWSPSTRDRQISPDDVQRALEAARVVTAERSRDRSRSPRHVVDGQDGIKNRSMLGHRIEVQTTIVSEP
jgi:cell division ATPase FtsA